MSVYVYYAVQLEVAVVGRAQFAAMRHQRSRRRNGRLFCSCIDLLIASCCKRLLLIAGSRTYTVPFRQVRLMFHVWYSPWLQHLAIGGAALPLPLRFAQYALGYVLAFVAVRLIVLAVAQRGERGGAGQVHVDALAGFVGLRRRHHCQACARLSFVRLFVTARRWCLLDCWAICSRRCRIWRICESLVALASRTKSFKCLYLLLHWFFFFLFDLLSVTFRQNESNQ